MKISQIYDSTVLINTETQHELCSLFIRIQEFYESPYENINNKHFSLDTYIDTYAKETGSFTYFSDWRGFNVPGDAFTRFFIVFGNDLRLKEYQLLTNILEHFEVDELFELPSKFYIIGTYAESPAILSHELSHAFYHISENYKNLIDVELSFCKKSEQAIKNMKHKLLKKGYSKKVLNDEVQAYLITSSYWYLLKNFGLHNVPWRIIPKLKQIFKREGGAL